ncbi:MAG: hypothetical protein Q8R33_22625, partial [Burkholderiales bacterium]|nr:hypothetical protein [Burkholderiales bacterium]
NRNDRHRHRSRWNVARAVPHASTRTRHLSVVAFNLGRRQEGLEAALTLDLPGLVYSFHFYEPHEFTHQGLPGQPAALVYPGQGWDKARLSQAMGEARKFAAKHRAPMYVGEFSCVRWAPGGSCPRYLADAVSLFETEAWSWTYHCWRCYQGWDSEVPQHIPQAQRAGYLPAHRRADSPSLLLLRKAMERNRKSTRH